MEQFKTSDSFLKSLEERAKELNCLYGIEELLSNPEKNLEDILEEIVKIIPPGWQYPDYCKSRILFENKYYQSENFEISSWFLKSNIKVNDEYVGSIEVYYTSEFPYFDEGPFLKEERKLLDTIADRISHFILYKQLKSVFQEWENEKDKLSHSSKPEWSVVVELLRMTDKHLFSIISKKMVNHLFYKGITEAKELFGKYGNDEDNELSGPEISRPSKKQNVENTNKLNFDVFNVASKNMSSEDIYKYIQKWIHEEKSNFLVKSLIDQNTPLNEVSDAIRRYCNINPDVEDETSPVIKSIRVSMIRRFLTDQLEFINIAKNYCVISDFDELLQKMVYPLDSHGKLGGKSAGVFLAKRIIARDNEYSELLSKIKTPKTWYLTSDALLNFVYYNNLEEVIEVKYKEIDEIRQEYPHIIQAFKNSKFPTDIVNGLSRALDDFGDKPIIVRSSSLLEDRMGAACAGKYKSLFLANQGTKHQRMESLMDAIAEVFASTFGPDPIGYRIERGLLDFNEEMGIMIQEVVGKKIGKYYFPAFAGVAFSNNEFRWSPRIKREDGLIRMVPGLGTRAVDRLADDYPVLIAPGQPNLRVNWTIDEIVGYSPKNADVINLESNTFETVPIKTLLNETGNNYPLINEIFSIYEEGHLKKPVGMGVDTKKHDLVVTFENLISNLNFISQIHAILKILHEKLETPSDIEFACDGKDLYLLQSRPQSSFFDNATSIIPRDIAPERILFTANRYVSNGIIPDIIYVVYIDPVGYSSRSDLSDLKLIGRIVGQLNKLLPKKSFILIGPGRWGSRDDIRLGVNVTYSDINNTALLIEVARKKGNYVPDLSFGTHFFQDLVESSIRYLPLYPDQPNVIFNSSFFDYNENILTRFLPEYKHLEDTVKVINIPETTAGMILRVLMNADEDKAMAYFTHHSTKVIYKTISHTKDENLYTEEPLLWRLRMADTIASKLDKKKYGVKGMYLFGTTFNGSAGANSDIDILVHFDGTNEQKTLLNTWFEGWNLCLSAVNFNRTGYKIDKILDTYLMTDEELREHKYYSDMIKPKSTTSKPLKVR